MANMTTTTAAAFIPEIWSQKVLTAVEDNLVMASLVRRDFEGEVGQFGDVVNVPTLSNLSVGTKAADTDVTFSAVTETTTPIAIDRHKYVAFVVEDIVRVQSNVDLISAYTERAGYALAKQIDADLLALYTELTQSVNAPDVDHTWEETVLEATALLDVAGAPEKGRSLIVRPALKSELLKVDRFVTSGSMLEPTPVRTGRIGELYGCQVYVTNQVPLGSDPVIHHNLLLQRDAFALAIQVAPRVQAENSVDALGTKVVVDVVYGVATLRDTFAVDIRG